MRDLVSDQLDFSQLPRRLPGRRVKHRMKRNWINMYSKDGSALRVETVINQPDEFRIRRRVRRQGRHADLWLRLRFPLIEPDVRISRIRLSDLISRESSRGCADTSSADP
jgi:hypothetical protein